MKRTVTYKGQEIEIEFNALTWYPNFQESEDDYFLARVKMDETDKFNRYIMEFEKGFGYAQVRITKEEFEQLQGEKMGKYGIAGVAYGILESKVGEGNLDVNRIEPSINPPSIVGYQIVENHIEGWVDRHGDFYKVTPSFEQHYIIDYLNGRAIDRADRDKKFIIVNRLGGWLLQYSRLLAQEVEKLAVKYGIEVDKYLSMPINEIQCFIVLNHPNITKKEVLAVLQFYMNDYYATTNLGRSRKMQMDEQCLTA